MAKALYGTRAPKSSLPPKLFDTGGLDLAVLVRCLNRLGNPDQTLAAAQKADKLVRAAGVTWEALLLPTRVAPPRPKPKPNTDIINVARQCLRSGKLSV
jgi:hypothetical protein